MNPTYISPSVNKSFGYYVVLDFEATCEQNTKIHPQEIIEFPSVLVNAQTFQIEDKFQIYVRPTAHPKLTEFCKHLTGIQQEWVDNGVLITQAMELHKQWLLKHGLLSENKTFAFVTCGDWDLNTCLPSQAYSQNFSVPTYFNSWVNIKTLFSQFYKTKVMGMPGMLSRLNLSLDGRHHSGIDDCCNIAKILIQMLKDGAEIQINGRRGYF